MGSCRNPDGGSGLIFMTPIFLKDPDAKLDYVVDWSAWLDGDTISSSSWIVPDGITLESDVHTNTTSTVWLSGGTPGDTHHVVNRIATAGGRIDDRTIIVVIRQK